jgi:hypothetical protein
MIKDLIFETLDHCPACKAKDISFYISKYDEFLKQEFNLFKCKACELIFVNPRVHESHMSELYSDSYFHGNNWDSDTNYHSNYENVNRLIQLEKLYQSHYEYIVRQTSIDKPKILDIGAGLGLFTECVSKLYLNVDITSLDYSLHAVEHMKLRGISAMQGTISSLELKTKYDAIYMR